MYLRNHLVKVVAEFFYVDFLLGGNEDARTLLVRNPEVLQFIESAVLLLRRSE